MKRAVAYSKLTLAVLCGRSLTYHWHCSRFFYVRTTPTPVRNKHSLFAVAFDGDAICYSHSATDRSTCCPAYALQRTLLQVSTVFRDS